MIFMSKLKIAQDILDIIYPIGSVYINTINVNPNKLFGGVWEEFATGRTLIGIDPSKEEFNSIEKTGGTDTHKHISPLTWHIPSGSNTAYVGTTNQYGSIKDYKRDVYASIVNFRGSPTTWKELLAYYTSSEKIYPPYITVYMWKRIS